MGRTMNQEQAQSIHNSESWDLVCKEIDTWINYSLNKLKNCSKEELELIQVRVRTLEEVKNLPKIVIDRD